MMRPCQIGWKFWYPEIIKRSIIWGDSFFIAFGADNVQGEMCLAWGIFKSCSHIIKPLSMLSPHQALSWSVIGNTVNYVQTSFKWGRDLKIALPFGVVVTPYAFVILPQYLKLGRSQCCSIFVAKWLPFCEEKYEEVYPFVFPIIVFLSIIPGLNYFRIACNFTLQLI